VLLRLRPRDAFSEKRSLLFTISFEVNITRQYLVHELTMAPENTLHMATSQARDRLDRRKTERQAVPDYDRESYEDDDEDDDDEHDDDGNDDSDEEINLRRRFDQIRADIRAGEQRLDGSRLSSFAAHHGDMLGNTTSDIDNTTLLHLLIEDTKNENFDRYKPLITLLIQRYPELLGKRDGNEKTPLYLAASKKNLKLIRTVCEAHIEAGGDIDAVLSVPCLHLRNCLHAAIMRQAMPKLALYLIRKAGKRSLLAQDDEGRTPLHLAVEYKRCTEAQLEVVQVMISAADEAIDMRTYTQEPLSPYRHHHASKASFMVDRDKKTRTAAVDKASTSKEGMAPKLNVNVRVPNDPGIATPAISQKLGMGPTTSIGATSREEPPAEPLRRMEADIATSLLRRSTNATSSPQGEPPKSWATKEAGSKKKEEPTVSNLTAGAISDHLKMHCMRTRSSEDAIDFLYGRIPGTLLHNWNLPFPEQRCKH
jgi:ankyrin repeat protein